MSALHTTPAHAERLALCDLFMEVGPDAPTLCEGWAARDLAAHLVVRERRPDAAPGVFVSALARYTEKVRLSEAQRPWPELVERVRGGPPAWNPMRLQKIDELVNTGEFFVHHEDVRRAQTGWTARTLSAELEDVLARTLARSKMLTRAAKVGIVLEPEGGETVRVRKGDPVVTIRGPVAEIVLYVFGRKSVAQVDLDGPNEAVERVRTASFGL